MIKTLRRKGEPRQVMASNTHFFAKRELEILSKSCEDPDNRPLIEEFIPEILLLVDKFGNSGQSGGSAPYVATALSKAIKKLCLQEPICPITGIDDEWINVAEFNDRIPMWQNARCGQVFKDQNGKAYYLDAIIWKADTWNMERTSNDWDTFTGIVEGIPSRQYIKSFPFSPKRFYIDVTRVQYDPSVHNSAQSVSTGLDGDVVYFIKDRSQLDKVFNYYQSMGQL